MSVSVIGGSTASLNSTVSQLTAEQQAEISAGKVRSGGTSAGTAVRIYSGGTQPYPNGDPNGVAGDLWFA
jgi:hypothetical protein